jgi:hypothetical protein
VEWFGPLPPEQLPDRFDAPARTTEMDHRVAVRAYRAQVGHWINLMLAAFFGQRAEVVDVN